MKHFLLSLLILGFLIGRSQTQTFQKTYGSTGYDISCDVIQTADKGYAILGSHNYSGLYILKTDSLGNKQWSRSYAITQPNMFGRSFSQTADGGFIIGGKVFTSNYYYGVIIKTDAAGNTSWVKLQTGFSDITSIKPALGGGYIATGNRTLFFNNRNTLARFDGSGNLIWSRSLTTSTTLNDVIQLAADSSFITYNTNTTSSVNVTFSRWSQNANLMWSKTVTSSSLTGGGLSGRLYENGNEVQISFNSATCPGILKIDKNGTNAKMIGMSCALYNYALTDAYPTANKGTVILGQYNQGSATYGTRNLFLASIDSTGTLLWAKSIGGVNDEAPASIKKTKDKGFVLVGTTKSFSVYMDDIYLIKTDSLGVSGCNTSNIFFVTSSLIPNVNTNTPVIDSVFGSLSSSYTLNETNPTEISYNACGCVAPVASFTPSTFGDMNNNSTWASKYYWTCTCMPGIIDSTIINKSYYGGPFPNGTYTVCLKVKNSCGIDSLCQPFTYTYYPIGIQETEETVSLMVYPNPVHDELIVSYLGHTSNTDAIRVKIINSVGALVYSGIINNQTKTISVSEWSSGLYILELVLGDKIVTRKFVKD